MDELYQDDEYLLGTDQTNGSRVQSLRGVESDEVGHGDGGEHDQSGPPDWLAFLVAFGGVFGATLFLRVFLILVCNQRDRILRCSREKLFHREVTEAQKRTSVSRKSGNDTSRTTSHLTSGRVAAEAIPAVIYESYDGDFYIKYEDCGKIRSGFIKVQLKNNCTNGCYDVRGICADAAGCATIIDGSVSYAGDAWWVTEILGEDEERLGLKVFSKGMFDLTLGTFSGSWVSNTGTQGRYLTFEAKNVITSLLNIPVASAVTEKSLAVPKEEVVV